MRKLARQCKHNDDGQAILKTELQLTTQLVDFFFLKHNQNGCIILMKNDTYIHKIFNAVSFTYVNKCPTHRHFAWDISAFNCMVITHKLFINHCINRCMLVE